MSIFVPSSVRSIKNSKLEMNDSFHISSTTANNSKAISGHKHVSARSCKKNDYAVCCTFNYNHTNSTRTNQDLNEDTIDTGDKMYSASCSTSNRNADINNQDQNINDSIHDVTNDGGDKGNNNGNNININITDASTNNNNNNNNNNGSPDQESNPDSPAGGGEEENQPVLLGIPLRQLVDMMIFIMNTFEDKDKGLTLKEIKRRLVVCGFLDPGVSLRRALVFGLKKGLIRRAAWAVKSGVNGVYVVGQEKGEEQKRPKSGMKISKNKKGEGQEARKGSSKKRGKGRGKGRGPRGGGNGKKHSLSREGKGIRTFKPKRKIKRL